MFLQQREYLSSGPKNGDIHGIFMGYIWVNYNISLTWIKAIWGWFPYKNHDSSEGEQWGRDEIYPDKFTDLKIAAVHHTAITGDDEFLTRSFFIQIRTTGGAIGVRKMGIYLW